MTKCQKITFFDIFHKICQNHTFPLFPIFPKNQKITLFHCDSENTQFSHFHKNAHFGDIQDFGYFGDILENGVFQKMAIFGVLEDLPKMANFGVFGKMVKNGVFWGYPQNGDFWTITMCDFPHTHYMKGSILQTPGESFYIFLIYIF